jgi:Tripartite tricarboxylate transporter family receptor
MHELGSIDVMRLDRTLGQLPAQSGCMSMRTSLEEGIKPHRFAGIFPEQFLTEAGGHREAVVAADQRMVIRCFRDDLAGFVHGVTSPQRWPGVPDIPAVAETVPGFEAVGFYGIAAPKGTPPEIVAILNQAIGEALKDPKSVARLTEIGGIPTPMTPAEFGRLVADETEKWRKVVEFAGVSVE